MNGPQRFKLFSAIAAVALVFHSESASACAACFGKSDSPLAAGMNWGFSACWGGGVCPWRDCDVLCLPGKKGGNDRASGTAG